MKTKFKVQHTSEIFIALVRSLERLTFAEAVRIQAAEDCNEITKTGRWVTGALNVAALKGGDDIPADIIELLLSIEDHHRIREDTWSMVTQAQFDATKEALFKGLEERFSIESSE
ncbi:hypothetical protein DB347_17730 [Opitutaceae bacterium EW11]|nr:hypothetical protein DB347_17730 [Opitutaceae bacterium EW11]